MHLTVPCLSLFTVSRADVSSVGVPHRGAFEADILANAGPINAYFQTVGHQYRLWPSATCPLTPVVLDPYALPVATKTVAPVNFRNRIVALNAFAPSPPTQEEKFHTSPVVRRNAVTGTVVLADGFTFNFYDTLRFAPRIHGAYNGLCGAGYLAHDIVTGGPVCRCPSPVGNDTACQFDQRSCIEPSTMRLCNGIPNATCAFNRSAVAWLAENPFFSPGVLQVSGVVSAASEFVGAPCWGCFSGQ